MLPSCLQCREQISGFQYGGVVLLGHGRPARRYHARVTTLARTTLLPIWNTWTRHASSSKTWTRLWWKNSVCDGKVLLVPEADASWRVGRERTPVDRDGDDDSRTLCSACIFRSSSPLRVGMKAPAANARVCPGLGSDGPTTLSSEVCHRLPRVTFSVVPSRALCQVTFNEIGRTTFPFFELALHRRDFDCVTDCFHSRKQFVFMSNCKITVRSDDPKRTAVSVVIRDLASGTFNKLCAQSVAT